MEMMVTRFEDGMLMLGGCCGRFCFHKGLSGVGESVFARRQDMKAITSLLHSTRERTNFWKDHLVLFKTNTKFLFFKKKNCNPSLIIKLKMVVTCEKFLFSKKKKMVLHVKTHHTNGLFSVLIIFFHTLLLLLNNIQLI